MRKQKIKTVNSKFWQGQKVTHPNRISHYGMWQRWKSQKSCNRKLRKANWLKFKKSITWPRRFAGGKNHPLTKLTKAFSCWFVQHCLRQSFTFVSGVFEQFSSVLVSFGPLICSSAISPSPPPSASPSNELFLFRFFRNLKLFLKWVWVSCCVEYQTKLFKFSLLTKEFGYLFWW